jgi:hypothetical protein
MLDDAQVSIPDESLEGSDPDDETLGDGEQAAA